MRPSLSTLHRHPPSQHDKQNLNPTVFNRARKKLALFARMHMSLTLSIEHSNDIRIYMHDVALHNSNRFSMVLHSKIYHNNIRLHTTASSLPARHMWYFSLCRPQHHRQQSIKPFSINPTPPDAILQGPNLMNNLAGVVIRVQAERHHTVATWEGGSLLDSQT